MTREEFEEIQRNRAKEAPAPPPTGTYHGDYYVQGSTTGIKPADQRTTTVNPRPVTNPGGGAGTSYGVGTSVATNDPGGPGAVPGPPVASPVIQPYHGDSAAATIKQNTPPPAPPPAPLSTTGQSPATIPEPAPRNTQAPKVQTQTVVNPGAGPESDFERYQREAAEEIRKVLRGEQPSLAAIQQRQAFDQAIAAQAALAAGQRGRSVASAGRTQANNTAALTGQAAVEGAKLRAQEVAGAVDDLASLATAGRGQDIGESQFERGLDVDIQKFNSTQLQNASAQDAENYLRALGLDDAYVKGIKELWLEYEKLGLTEEIEKLKIQTSVDLAKHAKTKDGWDKLLAVGGFLGGLGSAISGGSKASQSGGAGAAAGGSDRRMKVNVVKLEGEDLDEFLKATQSAFGWQYKDPNKPFRGHGMFHGPMAQDLEKSELAKTAISRDEEGMRILDFRRLAAMALMGLGRLDKRLSDIEGKK